MRPLFQNNHSLKPGSVLVALLWCVALLGIVVIGVLHTARMDLLVVKNYGDRIQAHYLALAGIEKAKALLYQNAHDRSRSAKNHTGELYDAPQQFKAVALGRGQFQVLRRGHDNEGGGVIYGVSDEESRLNLNLASQEQLMKLDGMTPDVAAAIMDWRDPDNAVTPGGAEAEYYATLQPPVQPRNGPFQTVRELLMVRGVSPALLLEKDVHQNGLLVPAGESEDDVYEPATDADAGWSGILTVDSSVANVNAAGQDRVNVQTADETALTAVHGISAQIARAIVAYRGEHQLESIADLLDVTAPRNQNNSNNQNNSRGNRNNSSGNSGNSNLSQDQTAPGQKLIDEQLLLDIADDICVKSDQDIPGAININTAAVDVLATLPGVDRDLAQAIISYRQSSGYFPNTAWLLKVSGMDTQTFKQIAPLVTARSETFRILSEGKINSTGVRQRIQAIVHVGLTEISTLSYREDDL